MNWLKQENLILLLEEMKKYEEYYKCFPEGQKIIPYLIGEPGVGKTAIAEGIAHRIVSGDVPENLKTKRISCTRYGSACCRHTIPRTV